MLKTTQGRKEGIKMTRDEKTSILCLVTRFSFEYLQNCSKEEIDKLYKERVEDKDGESK
jgi:hypothetical protein